MSSIEDIGCSSTIMGMDFVRKLGLIKKDLLPTGTSIRNVDKTAINIIGAVIT